MNSPLQAAIDAIVSLKKVQWLTGDLKDNEQKIANFLLISEAKDRIGILNDRLHPLWFNSEVITGALKECLIKGANIEIIFYRSSSPEEAAHSLQKFNPNLYQLWVNEERLTIYWSPVPFFQPFIFISNKGIFLETPGTECEKGFSRQNKILSLDWEKRFNAFLSSGKLVVLKKV